MRLDHMRHVVGGDRVVEAVGTGGRRARLQARERIAAGAQALGFRILGEPKLGIMAFNHPDVDALAVWSKLRERGFAVVGLSGELSQRERADALQALRDGHARVCVATDVAARGLDVTGVTHVINYSVPDSPEDYVHRIGRTGRAEKEGDAFTILSADELPAAQAVERLIGQTVERRRLPDFEYQYTTMLDDSKGAQKALAENLGRGRLRVGKRRR